MEKTRLRIRFTKTGTLRWISHRDLARTWERLLRRAGLELAFSEGFHPKPKISFPSALALGIEALDELVELEIVGQFELSEVERRIRAQLPDGMELLAIESLLSAKMKAKVSACRYRMTIASELCDKVRAEIDSVLAEPKLQVQRKDKVIECDTTHALFALELDENRLLITLPTTAGASVRPSDILERLGLGELLEAGEVLQRVEVVLNAPANATGSAPPQQNDLSETT